MGADLEAERATALSDQPDERELERFEQQAKRRHDHPDRWRTFFAAGTFVLAAILLVALISPKVIDSVGTQQHRDAARQVVTDYLTALSDGDSERLTALLPDASVHADEVERANRMLAQALERIQLVDVGQPDVDSPKDLFAWVPATVTLAGTTYELTMKLESHDGTWRLLDSSDSDMPSERVIVGSDLGGSLTIAGEQFELDAHDTSSAQGWAPTVKLFAHMGVYPIERPESDLVEAANEPTSIVLTPGIGAGSATHLVTGTPSAKLTERVQAALDAAVTSCVDRRNDEMPTTCPLWRQHGPSSISDAASVAVIEAPSLTMLSLTSIEVSGGKVQLTSTTGAERTVPMLWEPTTARIRYVNDEPELGL
ncbi:hypothetical protein JRG19_01920 [Pseudoclavibacter alba]|uniref:hypothetical protein n=1 Tax=Pseudoclavibacter albus TaxID=272241 RepID=UPI0019CF8DD1|nr:hypothetical protein [Pseudoclavibacter alba]MBN6777310.1 hypothetical protein [Pseudoclavibacter alba]